MEECKELKVTRDVIRDDREFVGIFDGVYDVMSNGGVMVMTAMVWRLRTLLSLSPNLSSSCFSVATASKVTWRLRERVESF